MNNKIKKVASTATPAQARAYSGPATAGIEYDISLDTLVVVPDTVGGSSGRRSFYPTFSGSGAPTNGTSGTQAGYAAQGSTYLRTSNGAFYTNTNTKASPTWTQLGTVTALTSAHIFVGNGSNVATDVAMSGDVTIDNTGLTAIGAAKVLASQLGVTAGTATASRAVVLDANKSVDVVRTPDLRIGASGSETAVTATGAELNKVAGVTAGTLTASKAIVVDANKSQDTSQITGQRSLGGTGVPGAATVATEVTKAVTAFADTTAKTVFTVTVPNAAHAAMFDLTFCGVLGAGGAIGAGEGTRVSNYQLVLARTAGVATVATLSSALGGAEAHVVGAASITSVVATLTAMSGAVGATQTFDVQVAITRSGGSSTNHTLFATSWLQNGNATGVTLA